MNFAHPLALLLLLLLIPVALLYWLRVRAPSRIVGTGRFWQKALAEEKARSRWQGRRTKFSLAVQMILVVLLALAAAGPQIPAAKRTVLIIDNSATMRATDVQPARIDAAKETALRLIESLRSCDEMAVVAVSPVPTEVQPLTSDPTLLKAAVDSVQATADPSAIEWAVKLAGKIPTPGKVPRLVLITDASEKEAAKRAQESGVEVLRVGTAAGNLAITCFTARRGKTGPTICEVFVEVRNQGNESAKGSVAITVKEKPGSSAPFTIVKDGVWQHVFLLDLPAAARLTAQIEPSDAYLFDNTAALDVPAAPADHRVTFAGGERSCVKEILAANRRVKFAESDADAASVIHIFDGKTPEQLPAGPALIFSPGGCDLWELGEAVADPLVTRVADDSPILSGVWLVNAYLPEARPLQIADSVRAVATPILWAGAMPLGYAIDRPQGRVVVIAGDLATSNLPLQAAFPQLISQALDWLDRQPPWKDEVVGQACNLSSPELDPVCGPAEKPTRQVQNLFHQDTDVRVPGDIGSEASDVMVRKPWPPLWIIPAVLAAVLLIIEWCLYQRRWTS